MFLVNWDLIGFFTVMAGFLIAIRAIDKIVFSDFGVPLPFWHRRLWNKKGWRGGTIWENYKKTIKH